MTALCDHGLVICLGSGGVGKTTVAAGLALSAATHGRRTLCLTVDPSKRLARALGLDGSATTRHRVKPESFVPFGLSLKADLEAMLVDSRAALDRIVERYAPSSEARKRIRQSPLYRYVADYLAGVQEYMALETLYEAHQAGEFDTIILDTPPSTNAIDFLTAPERLAGILASPATTVLTQTAKGSGKLLGRGAKTLLRGLSRFTGGGFLQEVAQFLADIDSLFGGFQERSAAVAALLRHENARRVVVTRPSTVAVGEALTFCESLKALGLNVDRLVLNAVPEAVHGAPDALARALTRHVGEDAAVAASDLEGFESAVSAACAWQKERAELAAKEIERLRRAQANLLLVPEVREDAEDLERLATVAGAFAI